LNLGSSYQPRDYRRTYDNGDLSEYYDNWYSSEYHDYDYHESDDSGEQTVLQIGYQNVVKYSFLVVKSTGFILKSIEKIARWRHS
jgi:hypothetical protein